MGNFRRHDGSLVWNVELFGRARYFYLVSIRGNLILNSYSSCCRVRINVGTGEEEKSFPGDGKIWTVFSYSECHVGTRGSSYQM